MDQSTVARPAALLEREHEVERVRAALRAAGQRAGKALVIEGAAGMGKSRLLEEARARAPDLGLRVLAARATELEQGFPFGVVRQLFERPLLEADAGERDRWLAGAAALAADLLAGAPTAAVAAAPGPSAGDPGYAWQHGLYWLASNLATDSPLALVIDDLQWCDAPSARALAFIARRLEGQPLALILATRPLDPALTPDAAALVADPAAELLRPSALTEAAVSALVAARLSDAPDDRFVRACLDVTGGNPFLVGELLEELAARGIDPTAAAADDVGAMVPRGVANAVLLRLARLAPEAAGLARALSALGDGAQMGDAARLAGLGAADLEAAMRALVSADVVESGGTVCFTHPILRAAIYGDLSPAERERLHHAAAAILRERGAPAGPDRGAGHAHRAGRRPRGGRTAAGRRPRRACPGRRSPRGHPALPRPRRAPRRSATAPQYCSSSARRTPAPAHRRRSLRCRRSSSAARTRPRSQRRQSSSAACSSIAGRAAEGAAILRRAQERLPAEEPARERLEIALLGVSYTSASARREADATIAALRDPGGPARGLLQATTLAALAMDEVMFLRSASTAIDLAERALAAPPARAPPQRELGDPGPGRPRGRGPS